MTHLALTDSKSRTAAGLARDLGFAEQDIQDALDACPAVFRKKSHPVDGDSKAFYTLHARFALRPYDSRSEDGGDLPEVRPEMLRVLLEFVNQRARDEIESERFDAGLRSTEAMADRARKSADRATVVAAGAGVLAVGATIISALLGG